MTQGTLKSNKATGAKPNGMGKKSSLGPKKGARVIKAKNKGLVKGEMLKKKHGAGLISMTEKTLGAKAGHLELLGIGKKGNRTTTGQKKGEKKIEVAKGGTKKFG